MSNTKLRIHNTDADNLISNLRGEIGEITFSWILMRNFMAQANNLRAEDDDKDIKNDLENSDLVMLDSLTHKLEDEIISRLAELAQPYVGKLTFYFAQVKFNALEKETSDFARFVRKNRFIEKRNYDISHKELPEEWTGHKLIIIPYSTLVRGITMANYLAKKFDVLYRGPIAKYQWQEIRRRRYKLSYPAKARYLMMHYLLPPPDEQERIMLEEELL